MKISNLHGLPEAIVAAVTFDDHEKRGDFSATELVLPPRIRMLRQRHDDEIVEDASERLWMLMGSAIHSVLERADSPNAFQEEPLVRDIAGVRIYGRPDHYELEAITDFKITSVWSVLHGVKPEWEAQLNIYKWMYQDYGFPVRHLWIAAILRDWSKGRAKQGGDYPAVQFRRLSVPIWPLAKVEGYIRDRIEAHSWANGLTDEQLPICKPEERWQRPATWAVMLKGRKPAKRVLESCAEAEMCLDTQLTLKDRARAFIEERPGECVRCQDYCSVNSWCSFYKELPNGGD